MAQRSNSDRDQEIAERGKKPQDVIVEHTLPAQEEVRQISDQQHEGNGAQCDAHGLAFLWTPAASNPGQNYDAGQDGDAAQPEAAGQGCGPEIVEAGFVFGGEEAEGVTESHFGEQRQNPGPQQRRREFTATGRTQ